MTTDIRNRLIDRMRTTLDQKTVNLPDSIPISVPLGPLADAIIAEMSEGGGVPVIPNYDPEVWDARRWTQPFSAEEALEGNVSDIAVAADPDVLNPGRVRFRSRQAGIEIDVSLPADDAEEFLVAGLSAVRAARDAAN